MRILYYLLMSYKCGQSGIQLNQRDELIPAPANVNPKPTPEDCSVETFHSFSTLEVCLVETFHSFCLCCNILPNENKILFIGSKS